MFSIEKQTAGQIWLKFGTELVLEGGKVLGGGSALYVKGSGLPLETQPCILAKTGRTWAPCSSGAIVTHYEGELI